MRKRDNMFWALIPRSKSTSTPLEAFGVFIKQAEKQLPEASVSDIKHRGYRITPRPTDVDTIEFMFRRFKRMTVKDPVACTWDLKEGGWVFWSYYR